MKNTDDPKGVKELSGKPAYWCSNCGCWMTSHNSKSHTNKGDKPTNYKNKRTRFDKDAKTFKKAKTGGYKTPQNVSSVMNAIKNSYANLSLFHVINDFVEDKKRFQFIQQPPSLYYNPTEAMKKIVEFGKILKITAVI
eukprot:scaffold2595_cov49-Attheya_sp.AAC.3